MTDRFSLSRQPQLLGRLFDESACRKGRVFRAGGGDGKCSTLVGCSAVRSVPLTVWGRQILTKTLRKTMKGLINKEKENRDNMHDIRAML